MLKPSGGLLKKIFNPVHKAVKKVGGGVGKAIGRLPGPKPPGFPKPKRPVAAPSRLAPRAPSSAGSSKGFGGYGGRRKMME